MYAVLNKTISDQPILLIFNTKIGVALGFILSKLEESDQNYGHERAAYEKCKMAAMTSSN